MLEIPARLKQFLARQKKLAIWSSGALSAIAVLVAAFLPISPLDRFNALVFDTYQTLRPRPSVALPLAVVVIDDESIRVLGQWPWPRTVLAEIIDRLTEMGAAAIGVDILLSEPDRTSPGLALARLREQGYKIFAPDEGAILDYDQRLAASFARSPVVSGLALTETTRTAPPAPKSGFAFAGSDPATYLNGYDGSIRNLPILDEPASGIGLIDFPPASDGIVRKVPLIERFGKRLYAGLSLEALRVAQGASAYIIKSTGAQGESDTGKPGMVSVKVGDFEVPTGPDGSMWIYYSRTPSAHIIPASRIVEAKPDLATADSIKGSVVLLGSSAVGLRNLVPTPLDAAVPGVMIHAAAIEQILAGVFLSRPDWAIGAEVAMAVFLTILVLAFLPQLPSLTNALITVNALALSLFVGWEAFVSYHFLLSPILPMQCSLLAYGVASGVRLLVSESERRYIRDAFTHYLSPSMVQQLMDNPRILNLGGENRELTILFCDIRGFTTLSEGLEPSEVTGFLNKFLTPMTNVLMENGATIDKFTGDGIMAFWNAPIEIDRHQRVACLSVLALQEALRNFNLSSQRPVSMGIGLNTGICCVGNLGSEQRFDYSAIGDAVNVASRVETMTKAFGLTNFVTGATAEGAADLALLEIGAVRLTGRETSTPLFTILGDNRFAATTAFKSLKDAHSRFLALSREESFEEARKYLEELRKLCPPEMEKFYVIEQRKLDAVCHDALPRDDRDAERSLARRSSSVVPPAKEEVAANINVEWHRPG